jgi:hypothetical protein
MKRILILTILALSSRAYALGTYSEGWAYVVPTKLEESGILFSSFEGTFNVAHFDRNEACDEAENLCYSPKPKTIQFSISDKNAATVNFVQSNINKEMLIHYRIHRIEPAGLSTDFEIVEAFGIHPDHAGDLKRQVVVKQSGSKRNFSLYGKVLQFEYKGRAVGTYEGLYYDKQRDRVHPFSVTNEEMAQHIILCMRSGKPYYFGVSVAFVTGFRETSYDIYEVNLDKPAGSIQTAPETEEKKKDEPADPKK